MLILTRYIGEKIQIGEDISLTFLGVRNGRVSLGVEAPPEVGVHREEIYKRVIAERREKKPTED